MAFSEATAGSPSLSRRGMLRASMLGASTVALGAGMAGQATPASAATFAKGADVSWLPQMEAAGYTFKDAGAPPGTC